MSEGSKGKDELLVLLLLWILYYVSGREFWVFVAAFIYTIIAAVVVVVALGIVLSEWLRERRRWRDWLQRIYGRRKK